MEGTNDDDLQQGSWAERSIHNVSVQGPQSIVILVGMDQGVVELLLQTSTQSLSGSDVGSGPFRHVLFILCYKDCADPPACTPVIFVVADSLVYMGLVNESL